MVHDDHARRHLFDRLEAALGQEAATTLMSGMSPVPWEDLATKKDLEILEHRLTALFRGELASAITIQTRQLLFAFVAALAILATLSITLTRLPTP